MEITVQELQSFLDNFDPKETISIYVDKKRVHVSEMFGELDPKIILGEVDGE